MNKPLFQEWSEAAFDEAARFERPVLVLDSFAGCAGYETFQNTVLDRPQTRRFLADRFVCIGVDRADRPELDDYFQQVHALFQRRPKGWPLLLFFTHEGRPFYATAHLAAESNGNTMGFDNLVSLIAKRYDEAREKVFAAAAELDDAVRASNNRFEKPPFLQTPIEYFLKHIKTPLDDGAFLLLMRLGKVAGSVDHISKPLALLWQIRSANAFDEATKWLADSTARQAPLDRAWRLAIEIALAENQGESGGIERLCEAARQLLSDAFFRGRWTDDSPLLAGLMAENLIWLSKKAQDPRFLSLAQMTLTHYRYEANRDPLRFAPLLGLKT